MTKNDFGEWSAKDSWTPAGGSHDLSTPQQGGASGDDSQRATEETSGAGDTSRYMPPSEAPRTPAPRPPHEPSARPEAPHGRQPVPEAAPGVYRPVPAAGRPAQLGAPSPARSTDGSARGGEQYWGYALKQPKRPKPSRKKTGIGATAAIALVTALLGGAGGAGIMYGLMEPHERPVAEQPAPVRTVSSGSGVNWVDIADQVQPSVVAIQSISGSGGSTGSGVIIDADGHIITNHHVIAGAQQIQVTMSDGRILSAEIVGSDASTDVAVLRLDSVPSDIAPATLGTSDSLVVGEPVVAIGNPLGLSSTVTTGIISALDRPVITREESSQNPVVTNAIQIDAAINPGNSGGPLFNAQAEVIGINSSIASLSNADGGPSGSIGLGFAIPIDLVNRVVSDLIEDGSVDHAFIGVTTTSEVVSVGGTSQVAAQVVEVSAGSPAEEHGIQKGDAILSINGQRLASNTALTGFVRQYAPGETVLLEVSRGGDLTEIELVLGQRE